MIKTADFSSFPERLSALTVHLRVRIGDNGWNSRIFSCGNSDDYYYHPVKIYTRPATTDEWDTLRQNYCSFPDDTGRCDVLEAKVIFKTHVPKWTEMCVGVPAARLGKNRTYDIILRFNGISLDLFVDGVLVDQDWPVGIVSACHQLFPASKGFDGVIERHELLPFAISDEEVMQRSGGDVLVRQREAEILGLEKDSMQYWTPRGHNQWVGDVWLGDTSTFDPNRLHLFYYADRRHHSNKFGANGDPIAHMSTTDLQHWEHYPHALEADRWNVIGTGRPVVKDGKMILAYGMHTNRVIGDEQIFTLKENESGDYTPCSFLSNGNIPSLPQGEPFYPMGTTFAESTDGIHFTKSNQLVHESQNPNIVNALDGSGYLMLAGYGKEGLYHSTDLLNWKLRDADILPYWRSPFYSSSECLCMFEWNGWHYIVGGRTGFWMSRSQTGPYWEGIDGKNTDAVKPRWDLNEGLWVPMVAAFKNNRRILFGSLTGPDFGWAGYLVLRELIQFPDGNLGLTWPEELRLPIRNKIIPEISAGGKVITGDAVAVNAASESRAEIAGLPRSFHLSLCITPDGDTSHVAIAGLDGKGNGCIISFLVKRGRVQWKTAIGDELPQLVPTLQEIHGEGSKIWGKEINSHIHSKGGDFVITEVEGLEKPFDLEMVFKYEDKSQSTIIDAFIAGHRTMITSRKGLVVNKLRFMADGPVKFEKISLGEI